ncbi:MAG: type 1 glutamine amidotransferase, partial [Lactobacillus panisapium]
MIVNVLQHTPNEGPGSIQKWAHLHHHEFYVYHPYQFGILPTAEETDFLVILGGPMSPNDDLPWIKQERQLI